MDEWEQLLARWTEELGKDAEYGPGASQIASAIPMLVAQAGAEAVCQTIHYAVMCWYRVNGGTEAAAPAEVTQNG